MSTDTSVFSGSPPLTRFIIEDYSHQTNPIELINEELGKIFAKEPLDEVMLELLVDGVKNCFDRFGSANFPKDLKDRLIRIPTDKELGKRAFAAAYHPEIEGSIQFVLRFLNSQFKENGSQDATDNHLSVLKRGCLYYPYLAEKQWKSLQTIAKNFHLIQRSYNQIISVTPRTAQIFKQLIVAIAPVLNNPQARYHDPVRVVKPLTDAEELASIENWESIPPEEISSVPSSSTDVLKDSMNPVKKTLSGYIEGITDKILFHYGDTLVRLFTSPLTRAFESQTLQSIVEEALSNTNTKFSDEEKRNWKDFLCSSIPSTVDNFFSKTSDAMKDPERGYEFIHGITKMITPFCFKKPDTNSFAHKILILKLLPQITLFLRDYQTSVDLIKKFPSTSKESKENEILCAMIQNLHSRSSRPIFRDEQNPEYFKEDLNKYIERVILMQCDALKIKLPSPIKECVTAIVNHYVYTIFDALLSPFLIAILIRRIIERKDKIETPEQTSTVPPIPPIPDDQFSSALSRELWEMIGPILNMGGNPKLISWIIEKFDGTIKKELFMRARTVNDELHEIISSDCVIMPFVFMDTLLFDYEDGTAIPVIKELLSKDKATQEKFARQTISEFRERPYKIVSKLIKKETSRFTLLLAETFGNLDTFLKTLFNQLIELSTQEKILKLLIIYLCDGYVNYLKETQE